MPPDTGWTKTINTDIAFYANRNSVAKAGILRGHQGVFLMAQAKWYDMGLDACMLEALACAGMP